MRRTALLFMRNSERCTRKRKWRIFEKDEEKHLTKIAPGFTMELVACNEYIWIIMQQKLRI
jgi:hypothetical protein